MILVQDCVDTSGACFIHHLLKRAFTDPHDIVVFLSFAHPFSHYDRILRKMGCNLVVQRDNKRLLFLDMLMRGRQSQGRTCEDILRSWYGEVQKAIEVSLPPEGGLRKVCVIIDDISLMEVESKGSPNLVLDFLHYCYSLTTQFGCSLITLNHDDVYSTVDRRAFPLKLEYLADVVIKVEPLATGLAADVHGQLTVVNKGLRDSYQSPDSKICNFNFKVKDSNVEFFYHGSRS